MSADFGCCALFLVGIAIAAETANKARVVQRR